MSDEAGCGKSQKPCRYEAEEYWGIENLAKGSVLLPSILFFKPWITYIYIYTYIIIFSSESTSWIAIWRELFLITDTMPGVVCLTTSRMSDSGNLSTCSSTLCRYTKPPITHSELGDPNEC